MKELYYVGLDVHKRTVSFCAKRANGGVVKQGTVAATRSSLQEWAAGLPGRWSGAMEATMFTGWIYDFLRPQAVELQVAHPYLLRAIAAAKKKNDRVDAAKLADALRCDLLPACWMAPSEMRELRRVLRYRNLLVREAVRMKNKKSASNYLLRNIANRPVGLFMLDSQCFFPRMFRGTWSSIRCNAN